MKAAATMLLRHFINPPKQIRKIQDIQEIEVSKQNITLVSCSNVVLKISSDKWNGYFTECRLHAPLKDYVYALVNDYYDVINSDTYASHDKELICNSICDSKNFNKLISIRSNGMSDGSVYARYLQSKDGSLIGISTYHSDEQQKQRIKVFVERYLRPHLIQYGSHRFLRYGKYQTIKTNKVLATEATAKMIGADELNPHAEYVKLKVSGCPNRALYGIFMEEAKGKCAMDIPPELRYQKLTGEFQRSLIRMNFLDVICYDLDHSPNNYNVYMDKDGMLEGVHVFDNNDASVFSLRNDINLSTYKNCACITLGNGIIHRPAVDKEITEKILKLSKRTVYRNLSPYLGVIPIECAWKRIQRLKKAIQFTRYAHPEVFLDRHMFGEDTLKLELSREYQKTYLISFLEDCRYRS